MGMNLTLHGAWCPGCAAYVEVEVDGLKVNGKVIVLAICPECMSDAALDGEQETAAIAWVNAAMQGRD